MGPTQSIRRLASLSLTALLAACSQDNSELAAETFTGTWAFSGPNGELVRTSAHHGGRAGQLSLVAVRAGRLVDLAARDASGEPELVAREFLAPADLERAGDGWTLEYDDVLARDLLIVEHPRTSPLFLDVVARLDARVERVLDHGLAPNELPPYTSLPRNAALALEFDDLLDSATVGASSVRLASGKIGDAPLAARLVLDPLHGAVVDVDRDGAPEFASTRVLVDPAISAAEAQAASGTLLEPRPFGLPAGAGGHEPNVVLRLALDGVDVVQNLSGARLSGDAAAFVDGAAGARDLVRAFATEPEGSEKSFLAAAAGLTLIGHQPVLVTQVTHQGGTDWLVDLAFETTECAAALARRDALVFVDGTTLVATAASNPPSGGVITGVTMRLVAGSIVTPSPAQVHAKWSSASTAPPACFVTITPPPQQLPARGVDPHATISATFNQPVDPASLGAFDTFSLVDADEASPVRRYVVGTLATSVSGTEVVFTPSAPLAHQQGTNERYGLVLSSGLESVGGTSFPASGLVASLRLAPQAPSVQSGGIALRFASTDEDVLPNVPVATPELRGQFLHDLATESVLPRPVTHFSTPLDASNPIVAAMVPFTAPVQTPLVPLGSKMMSVWRYHDLGIALLDEATMNIDVEGLAWTPFGGSVLTDQFPDFQMSLSHSGFLPDELVNSTTLLPAKPASGVVASYAQNVGSAAHDPLKVVHPKSYGYVVDPADTFVSATGTTLQPWPLNRQLPSGAPKSYYTWRDTGVQTLGAPNGFGAETGRFVQVLGIGTAGVPYPPSQVPTVGLPLLMEFRCYPNAASAGLNGFKISLAVNSSAAPFFRAYSSGGVLSGGQTKTVDPDNEPTATGGVGPTGLPTMPLDNIVYHGQADFVVRVSRAHTVWFDSGFAAPQLAGAVVEPYDALQPAGTQVIVAYRGATALSNPPSGTNLGSFANASNLDFYGEAKSLALGGQVAAQFQPTYLNGDSTWKSSVGALQGARYVQARISFVSNETTGARASLSSLGLAFVQ
ncbi:MAG: Ig-like domain-containing protein [Planctomycetes bacterium]|nr:Ig-like domain-containing protein [Planctomycetota bacterium]